MVWSASAPDTVAHPFIAQPRKFRSREGFSYAYN
jgi:hypothetical protein